MAKEKEFDEVGLFRAYKVFLEKGEFGKALSCLHHLYAFNKSKYYNIIQMYRNEIRKKVTKSNVALMKEHLKKAYHLCARDYFDDFMIYIEWERPDKDKFWQNRRSKLLDIARALQALEDNNLDELFISQAPRTGKTTLILFFVLWIVLRDSERSNLYTSYTDSVVQVFYNGLLEMLQDTTTYLWKDVFPECSIASTNAMDKLLNINRKKRYASFTGRSLYGTLNGACDCNGYEIADDLISGIEEAMNKDRLNAAWLKVDNNYLPRAKQNAKRLWIGTRWSLSDPIQRRIDLLENDIRFKSVRYRIVNVPALDEKDESNFEYLNGVGFDTEYYKQRRASFERNNDMASWLAQYMGTPIERDGSVFSPDDMRYYNGVLPDADADRIFAVVDPAFGGSDFAAAVFLHQYGNDFYVADVAYSDGDKRTTQPLIVKKAIEQNISAMYVEGTKMTAFYGEDLDKMLREKNHRVNMQITTKHFTGNGKEQRIFDKAPEIREQMIFLQPGKRSREYELAMQNLFSFTIAGKNKHDDFPDVCAMAMAMAVRFNAVLEIKARPF